VLRKEWGTIDCDSHLFPAVFQMFAVAAAQHNQELFSAIAANSIMRTNRIQKSVDTSLRTSSPT
jgi:hypothetical protein